MFVSVLRQIITKRNLKQTVFLQIETQIHILPIENYLLPKPYAHYPDSASCY